jgi:hypothetical protein
VLGACADGQSVTGDTCHVMTYTIQGSVPETSTRTHLSANTISKSGTLKESSVDVHKAEVRAGTILAAVMPLEDASASQLDAPKGVIWGVAHVVTTERTGGLGQLRQGQAQTQTNHHTNVIVRHIHGRPQAAVTSFSQSNAPGRAQLLIRVDTSSPHESMKILLRSRVAADTAFCSRGTVFPSNPR